MNDAEAVRVLLPPRWSVRSVWSDIGRLHDYSDLLLVLSKHRISVRYKQSLLGGLWALLQPLAMMIVFTAVFSRLVRMPSQGVPYALFAFTGLLFWTFFSGAIASGTGSLVGHAHLITKVYFPREILPFSYVISSLVDLALGAVVLLGLLLFYGVPVSTPIVMVLPIIAATSLFALGGSLILSAIQVRLRDVGIALPIVLQLWMFSSPVLYPLNAVPAAWRPFYDLNPLAGFVDAFRSSVLGLPVDRSALATAVLVTALLVPAAYAVFKRAEVTVADIV
jgi:lipopolysaccharide transport system permease protein